MRRELAALALLLVIANVADARVTSLTLSPMRMATVLPLMLVAGDPAVTTVGTNHTSAVTHAGATPLTRGSPSTLLILQSQSDAPQVVWLRLEPTSAPGSATVWLRLGNTTQVLLVTGAPVRTEGDPVALAPHGVLAVRGTMAPRFDARLDISILSHPTSDAGQTLRETWSVRP